MHNSKCTVVMFHYVRDLLNSRYPDIKGLDLNLFKEQIEFLSKNYNFIRTEELIDSFENNTSLPPNSVLLTFDDGYTDHFECVFPVLEKRKIQGSFYIPVQTVLENKILDVNKIHYILAAVPDKQDLINDIFNRLNNYRFEYGLMDNDFYFQKLAISSRFDSKEVIFIKRLLQVELEESLRSKITDELFIKYVTSDEKSFSRELYMSEDQVRIMRENGMHIGGHGYSHYWLSSLNKVKQAYEIDRSIDFIKNIGGDLDYWSMCYPYGDFNQDTLDLLKDRGCKLGLTTNVDIFDYTKNDFLKVPRLDTNDLPKDKNALPNEWFVI